MVVARPTRGASLRWSSRREFCIDTSMSKKSISPSSAWALDAGMAAASTGSGVRRDATPKSKEQKEKKRKREKEKEKRKRKKEKEKEGERERRRKRKRKRQEREGQKRKTR